MDDDFFDFFVNIFGLFLLCRRESEESQDEIVAGNQQVAINDVGISGDDLYVTNDDGLDVTDLGLSWTFVFKLWNFLLARKFVRRI